MVSEPSTSELSHRGHHRRLTPNPKREADIAQASCIGEILINLGTAVYHNRVLYIIPLES